MFPNYSCYQVLYCSLVCEKADRRLHALECDAMREVRAKRSRVTRKRAHELSFYLARLIGEPLGIWKQRDHL
jgi:hypothetical protein